MNSPSTPAGPGSVSGAPRLPDGFTGTFTSRYIDTGGLRQHVVCGGDGPPLLLLHGWPQTWYAWRLVMPALARDFTVIAPDQRGCGLSGRPADGYDTGALAGDLAALMDTLGHRRFAVAGHDTGMWIGYALAADHPGRVARLAVAETPLPGVSPSPPLFASAHLNNALWHFAFNRLAAVNDQLVTGREEVYFGWQFAAKAARPLPGYAVSHYIDTLAASPEALHASFAIYRALDASIAQNQQRKTQRLTMPVLGIGGEKSLRDQVAAAMKLAADDVQTLVIPGCGHHPAEEAPEETLAALTAFLAPYRDATAGLPTGLHDNAVRRARLSFPKGIVMSIKSKVLAAAGVLTLVGGLTGLGTVAASAATPRCGSGCVEVYSAKYATATSLGWVETVFLGIPLQGVPTEVRPASGSNPAEDLIIPTGTPVTVSQFYAEGMVSAAVDAHYHSEPAVQIEYAPYGKPTGLCTAVAVTAYQNEGLSLQPCSAPGVTVWIIDGNDSPATASQTPSHFPIVNGSDTDFVHPFSMTILGNPADQPFTPIIMQHLIGNPSNVPANQLWGAAFGPVS